MEWCGCQAVACWRMGLLFSLRNALYVTCALYGWDTVCRIYDSDKQLCHSVSVCALYHCRRHCRGRDGAGIMWRLELQNLLQVRCQCFDSLVHILCGHFFHDDLILVEMSPSVQHTSVHLKILFSEVIHLILWCSHMLILVDVTHWGVCVCVCDSGRLLRWEACVVIWHHVTQVSVHLGWV